MSDMETLMKEADEVIKDYGLACALQNGEQLDSLAALQAFIIRLIKNQR